ncbi:toxin glutamine deamidase domain-containing protein [Nocardia sp. NPDC059246]|uniref:toxin glutamine deamidase domain-containing protein n=1 Tax=Nocardia sp. NPDC059246 TaxID=3346789 RepID=UPI0036C51D6B
MEDALRDGDRFLVGADPRTNPYGKLINDGGPHVDVRRYNCLDQSLSALSSFYGDPQVGLPRFDDKLPNGEFNALGEHRGLNRARYWLGAHELGWPLNSSTPVVDQFAWLHDHISQRGELSAALVVNTWHARDANGNLLYEPDGTPTLDGSHATVVVYPRGASGPVWWDPQMGTMSDKPPLDMQLGSASLSFTAIDPNGGITGAGATHQGTGGGVSPTGSHLPAEPGSQHLPDRVRMGLLDAADSSGAGRSEADSGNGGLLHSERSDGSGDGLRQRETPDHLGPDVRPIDSDRRADGGGRTDLSAPLETEHPTDTGGSDRDRVSGDRGVPGRTAGTDHGTPAAREQGNPELSDERGRNPGTSPAGDGLGDRQPTARDLAGAPDPRVLDDPASHPAPLRDVDHYLTESRFSEALARADEHGLTTTIDGVETPVSDVIRDRLPQHADLAQAVRDSPFLERSLLERPKALAAVLLHPEEGAPILRDALGRVAERGPEACVSDPIDIVETPLTPEQRAVSTEVRDSLSDKGIADERQPGFDPKRRNDPEYQREFLQKQYDLWPETQRALNDLVTDIAGDAGEPGWRTEPKDEARAWDKIREYKGDVSQLTDLVGAKIVFDRVSDVYNALEKIAADPRVEIVSFKDRFASPQPSGYRDLQMKVRMPNGHIAELRVHLSHVDEVAVHEHALYEVRRDLEALAEQEGRLATPEESALQAELQRHYNEQFWEATKKGLAEELGGENGRRPNELEPDPIKREPGADPERSTPAHPEDIVSEREPGRVKDKPVPEDVHPVDHVESREEPPTREPKSEEEPAKLRDESPEQTVEPAADTNGKGAPPEGSEPVQPTDKADGKPDTPMTGHPETTPVLERPQQVTEARTGPPVEHSARAAEIVSTTNDPAEKPSASGKPEPEASHPDTTPSGDDSREMATHYKGNSRMEGGQISFDELSPKAKHLVNELAEAEHIPLRPGEVNADHLAELQQFSGYEHAIVQNKDGDLRLFRGKQTSSKIPEDLAGYRFILHTHPEDRLPGPPSEHERRLGFNTDSMRTDVENKKSTHIEAVVSRDGQVRFFTDEGVLDLPPGEYPRGGPLNDRGYVVPVDGLETHPAVGGPAQRNISTHTPDGGEPHATHPGDHQTKGETPAKVDQYVDEALALHSDELPIIEQHDGATAVDSLCKWLEITDPAQRQALTDIYQASHDHIAPFIVKVADDMLTSLKAQVAENPNLKVVFVGRDGHSLATAMTHLDPQFVHDHGHEVTLSRAVVETAVQDLENNSGHRFPEIDEFRGAAGKVRPESIEDAYHRLTEYFRDLGIPVGEPGSEIALVDTSYKGTVQELLSAVYPETRFEGHYMFFAESPADAHPGTKQGYALDLDAGRSNKGLPVRELPADPSLTFSHQDALGSIEEIMHGPLDSPRGIGPDGLPEQQLQRHDTDPLEGLNPDTIHERFTDPLVREAAKRIALVPVAQIAHSIAEMRAAGLDPRPALQAGHDNYVEQIRSWIGNDGGVDPNLRDVLDSFVRRGDKAQVRQLADLIEQAGLHPDEAARLWRDYTNSGIDAADKKAFIDQIRETRSGPEDPESLRAIHLGDTHETPQGHSQPDPIETHPTETHPAQGHPAEGDWYQHQRDEWSELNAREIAEKLESDWGVEAPHFDYSGLHPEVFREFARAVEDMKSRYPDVSLPKISIEQLPKDCYAETVPRVDNGRVSTDRIVLAGEYALNPKQMADHVIEDVADGHLVPGSGDRPLHSMFLHEYGHTIDFEGQRQAGLTAESALADYFTSSRGGMDKEAFTTWLDQLTDYSFAENGRLNPDEALAEAFANVEINGEAAPEAAKVLYWHLLDSANAHSMSPEGFTRIPKDTIARVFEPHRPDQPISKHEEPAHESSPASAQPPQSLQDLREGFKELREQTKSVVAAFNDPARADELPTLRAELAKQFDSLGLRSPESEAAAWQRFREHDPALAGYLEEHSQGLLPTEATPAEQPAHVDPDRQSMLTPHLKERFDEVKQRVDDLVKAYHDPARAPELPGLRVKFGDLVDRLGLRDPEASATAWDLFRQHDAAVAQYVEQSPQHLLPTAADLAHAYLEPPAKPSGDQPSRQPHTDPPHKEDPAGQHHPESHDQHAKNEPSPEDSEPRPHQEIPESAPAETLTSDEHDAVHRYTDPDADVFSDLNHRLRNELELDPEQQRLIAEMTSGREKLPTYNGTVWRGTHLTPEQIARYIPGAKLTEPAFTSTSRDPRRIFASNVEFVIHSETGRDISGLSARPGEKEVLFAPGTVFEVRGVVERPNAGLFGVTRVYLYESSAHAPAHEAPAEHAPAHEKSAENSEHEGLQHDQTPVGDSHPATELPVRHGTDRTALGNSPEVQRVYDNVRNEGEHDVIIHGNRFGKPTADGGFEIDPQKIVEAIHNNPNYIEGTPIRLLSCHSGNDIGWAQHIANELGVPVRAPSDLVGVRAVPDSPATLHDSAEWRTFHPTEADGTAPKPTVYKPTDQPDGRLPKYEEDPRENWDILGNEKPGGERTPPPDRSTDNRPATEPGEDESPSSERIDRPVDDRNGEYGHPRATLDDLGFPDGEGIAAVDLPRFEQALAVTELVPTEEVRFTQRSVSRETSDGLPIQTLADHMADGGWRGGPIHAVVAEDGRISSLDNRRLTAAQMAELDHVPTALHSPNDRLADWPHEWDTDRRERNPLRVDIRRLPDGTLRVGGDEGEIVYRRGQVAETWGEIALFRSAEQRSLLPGDLAGSDQRPVFAAKPAPAIEIDLPPTDHQAIADAVRAARPEADQILSDLHSTLENVNRGLDLVRNPVETRGEDHRVKSEESLARKFQTERNPDETIDRFLNRVNDLVRFSTRMPDGEGYRPALDAVLSRLEEHGYEVVDIKNFWQEDNRYLGLNATLRSPHGREFELQFPTDAAWRANKLTHEPYEVFRRTNEPSPEPIERRVHSFFEILRTNEELNLGKRIPTGVDERWSPTDSSLAKWVRKNPDQWRRYEDWLHENNRDLRWVTDQFGLDLDKHLPGYKTEKPEDGNGVPGLPEADTDGPSQPDPARTGPAPELTPEQRAQHWQHLDQVEARHPEEFDHLQRDPDKNGGISEPSKDEARVGLDLREQGRLPQDIQRPDQADHGEFHSRSDEKYYDIKGVHSDWPPFNNVRDKSKPFKGAYDPAKNSRWVEKLREQIEEKNRTVIIDLRNASQAAIDDVQLIVRTHGWDDDVIWYP